MTTTNEQDIIEAIRMFIGKDEDPLDVEEPLPEEETSPGIKVRVKTEPPSVKINIKNRSEFIYKSVEVWMETI